MKNVALILTMVLLSLTVAANNVNIEKTQFNWKGTKVTGEHVGTLSLQKAYLQYNPKGLIKGGEFIIDMNSMKVTDLSGEWATKFLNHIKSDDFFHVKKFPTAKLVIKGDTGQTLSGDLTIKGKTRPVKIAYSKKENVYQGTLKFDRTKFGMVYGSGNFFKNLGDKMIHNEVTVSFKVVLK